MLELKWRKRLVLVALGFVVSNNNSARDGIQVELRTHIAPPYQVKVDEVLTGEAVESVKCVFKTLDKRYNIKLMPWNRAIKEVETEQAHGYFAVAEDSNINLFATLSAPLILEKWSWFFSRKLHPKRQRNSFRHALIGVLSDSNEAIWLERRGYKIASKARSLELLVNQLERGRVEVVLSNSQIFHRELIKAGIENDVQSMFTKFTPLGMYFSNSFIKKNPYFIKRFNQAVGPCTLQQIKLTNQDRLLLLQLANSRLRAIANQPVVLTALAEQNAKHRMLTLQQELTLDQQWLDELKEKEQPLISSVLANKLSRYLQEVKKTSNGLFAEIFVMDIKGLNVGQSDITSDYWQGDESKYKNTVLIGKDAIFIDEIQFDESSQHFQAQVSLSIADPKTGRVSGAITFGIDVEKALQQY
ncbi:hypothetical protein H0A36_12995 [Endozoicomonas sp. SM1973]|uniref:Solute-binding protein family 3/N-terminal domain-containing protein n=1 Tax=Spartinivicinus marinus TaxID=2994442 RepID=A0A853IAR3_9GAMM|nr:hypothetical protein [Spartinivicinus marinus]MCX4029688.1 hypothetical protein [Spartinivicinus marinus]NYZ66931.1 hypothetical protein [Spartinivicinus marinus]